jgi:hypothetical protein
VLESKADNGVGKWPRQEVPAYTMVILVLGNALNSYVQPPTTTTTGDCQASGSGSIIHIDGQAVGESIPVVGAPFNLTYFSDRMAGYTQPFDIQIPITGPSNPPGTTGGV